jgi:hypothetical protein
MAQLSLNNPDRIWLEDTQEIFLIPLHLYRHPTHKFYFQIYPFIISFHPKNNLIHNLFIF